MTKHLPLERCQDELHDFLKAMNGTKFLRKLLVAKNSDTVNADLYKSLSVAVSSSFCANVNCAKEFLSMQETFELMALNKENTVELRTNALDCVIGILRATSTSKNQILNHFKFNQVEDITDPSFSSRLLPLLDLVSLHIDDLPYFAKLYATDRSDVGIMAAESVCRSVCMLSEKEDFYCYKEIDNLDTASSNNQVAFYLSKGASAVLLSANSAPEKHQECALTVANHLSVYFGPAWPFLPGLYQSGLSKGDKIISLMIHLVSVELSVQMTKLRGLYFSQATDAKDESTTKVKRRSFVCVSDCVSLFDSTIHFLVGIDEETSSKLDPKFHWYEVDIEILMHLRHGMIVIAETIVDFLFLVSMEIQSGSESQIIDSDLSHMIDQCINSVDNWLSEDPGAKVDEMRVQFEKCKSQLSGHRTKRRL